MSPEPLADADKLMCRRAAHAGRQLVELPAAPPRRRRRVPGEQRGDLLLPGRPCRSAGYAPTGSACTGTYTSGRRRSTINVVVRDGDVFLHPTRLPRAVHRRARVPDVLPERARRTGWRAVDGVLRRPGPPLGPRHLGRHGPRPPLPDDDRHWPDADERSIGIGVIGFGWMGQAHSRSAAGASRVTSPSASYEPRARRLSPTPSPERRDEAARSFGFARGRRRLAAVVEHPDVDVVFVTAPNMLHVEMVVAAADAGKHVFCEKPVGGTPEQTVAAARGSPPGRRHHRRRLQLPLGAARAARPAADRRRPARRRSPTTAAGSSRCTAAIRSGCCRGGSSSDEAGHGVSSDILSHAVDLAHLPRRSDHQGRRHTARRSSASAHCPAAAAPTTTAASRAIPTGAGDQRGLRRRVVRVRRRRPRHASSARRSMVGPESQMAFEVYGTKGALAWNLETDERAAASTSSTTTSCAAGYTTVYGGDRYPFHGHFVPGDANGIGFEDLIRIEDHEFLDVGRRGRAARRRASTEALDYVSFQAAAAVVRVRPVGGRRIPGRNRWHEDRPLHDRRRRSSAT